MEEIISKRDLSSVNNKVTIIICKRDSSIVGLGTGDSPSGHVALRTYGEDAFYASLYGVFKKGQSRLGYVQAILETQPLDKKMDDRQEAIDLFTLDAKKIKDFFWGWLEESVENKDKDRVHIMRGSVDKNYQSNQKQLEIRAYEKKNHRKIDDGPIYLDFKKVKYNACEGSSFLANNDTLEFVSCTGLVDRLLREGGIKNILKNYDSKMHTVTRSSLFGLGIGVATAGITALFGGPVALFGIAGFVGGSVGSATQNGTDSVEGFNVAITPDGISALVKNAKVAEFEYKRNSNQNESYFSFFRRFTETTILTNQEYSSFQQKH